MSEREDIKTINMTKIEMKSPRRGVTTTRRARLDAHHRMAVAGLERSCNLISDLDEPHAPSLRYILSLARCARWPRTLIAGGSAASRGGYRMAARSAGGRLCGGERRPSVSA